MSDCRGGDVRAQLGCGDRQRFRIRVRGVVQGVGFRPFVFGLARSLSLSGWVLNDGAGLLLEIEGSAESCGAFQRQLSVQAPPLAKIAGVEVTDRPLAEGQTASSFNILPSPSEGAVTTGVGPDAAVCDACLSELFDPNDRRYRYPFLNCTHCGPRYTITCRLPYDRPQTAMASFALCSDCASEYRDPNDRRFHAQPVACPSCGPQLSHAIPDILRAIGDGAIVALKGLGGFHLVCDARQTAPVDRLRARKQRNGKPFAVMVANLPSAATLGGVSTEEAGLLTGPERPVVLLRRHGSGAAALASGVAPDLAWLGVMLPYTPLHYLLFHEAAGRPDGTAWLAGPQSLVLVMTSANPGGEPLVIANAEARSRLAGIADLVVDHDRDIVVRADDSVVRWAGGGPAYLRRARGYVPRSVGLPRPVPPILAVGGLLKNTVCLTRGVEAFPSQHIGDLENAATLTFFRETIDHLWRVLDVQPVAVAHDLHPDFAATRFALETGLPCVPVQHHHAHVAAVAAEHGLDGPVIGLALDGFGLGEADGADTETGLAWGGELLRLDGQGGYRRLGHLAPLRQPGGDVAARQPWRMAAAALHRLRRSDLITARFRHYGNCAVLIQMLDRGVNAPWTTSLGRWFDAACGLLDVRPIAGYEGEAPMILESLVRCPRIAPGTWRIDKGTLDLLPLLGELSHLNATDGADLFHGTLISALLDWVMTVLKAEGQTRVVLSGGCLANAVLADGLMAGFASKGISALTARQVPAGDGGLSLGQAWVAAQRLTAEGCV